MSMSPADDRLETIDPNPDLFLLFKQFDRAYFNGKLKKVEVRWNTVMKSFAGYCRMDNKGKCTITLSEPLLKFRPRKDIVETLLHEMIHAFLYITGQQPDDEDGHGEAFKATAARISKLSGVEIAEFHHFANEVEHYLHVWRCTGRCKNEGPYYGYLSRTRNMAPSKVDKWWDEHASYCNGRFIKIKEPPRFRRRNESNACAKLIQPTTGNPVVDQYQHIWQCTGQCRYEEPHYGYVTRTRNLPPSEKNDKWWAQHVATCGGEFLKVKEPEGFRPKNSAHS